VRLVAQGGQQPFEVLTAWATRAQMCRDTRVPLLGLGVGGDHLGMSATHR
jgi:hypothetical protein